MVLLADASGRHPGRPEGTAGAGDQSPAPLPAAPVHPGQYLERSFLEPRHITQQALARALGVSRRRVNELIRGHRSITPDTAMRLAAFFRTDPLLWLYLQAAWDAHEARGKLAGLPGGTGERAAAGNR